jgi:hypothetical protein
MTRQKDNSALNSVLEVLIDSGLDGAWPMPWPR